MLPNKLNKGDKIGIIVPSDPIYQSKLEDINNSILLMEQAGFQIQFANNAFSNSLGYSAAVEEKAEDINNLFEDDEIKAIVCATGGCNCNSLFEYINYDTIKKHPKIICGFSDATSILNIIHEKTGLVTFHGPTFKSLTSWETAYSYQEFSKRFLEGSLQLGQVDDVDVVVRQGQAEGVLIGGNLSLVSDLSSGRYHIDFTNKILFVEELGIESEPSMVSHYLYHMKQNGVFDKIKGIWIGNYEHPSNVPIEKIVQDVLEEKYHFPILKSNYFGHTERKTVIPIGTMAKIDTTKERKIELVEKCVQ